MEQGLKRQSILWLWNSGWSIEVVMLKGFGEHVCVSLKLGAGNPFWGRLLPWGKSWSWGLFLKKVLCLFLLGEGIPCQKPESHPCKLYCVSYCFRSREIQPCSGSCSFCNFQYPIACLCVLRGKSHFILFFTNLLLIFLSLPHDPNDLISSTWKPLMKTSVWLIVS